MSMAPTLWVIIKLSHYLQLRTIIPSDLVEVINEELHIICDNRLPSTDNYLFCFTYMEHSVKLVVEQQIKYLHCTIYRHSKEFS